MDSEQRITLDAPGRGALDGRRAAPRVAVLGRAAAVRARPDLGPEHAKAAWTSGPAPRPGRPCAGAGRDGGLADPDRGWPSHPAWSACPAARRTHLLRASRGRSGAAALADQRLPPAPRPLLRARAVEPASSREPALLPAPDRRKSVKIVVFGATGIVGLGRCCPSSPPSTTSSPSRGDGARPRTA